MGITNLGAVSMSAGGVYNPETVYKKYKVVSANGGSYMYINPIPAAGVDVTDTSHWQQIASRGMTGPSAYDAAVAGGYMGSEAEFNAANAGIEAAKDATLDAAETANEAAENAETAAYRSMLWRKTASGNPVPVYPVPESPLYPRVSGMFTQEGEGDPSPENIRQITPWLASGETVKVKRTGKNLIDATGFTLHKASARTKNVLLNTRLQDANYTLSFDVSVNTLSSEFTAECFLGKTRKKVFLFSAGATGRLTASITGSGEYDKLYFYISSVDADTATISLDNIQLEIGSTATSYEPYTEQEITLTAPQEIPAGWMDNEGRGQGTHGYIASYVDETVPDGWVSSIGELSAGAQVVYPLATPIDITPTAAPLISIPQLDRITPRQNVMTASTGNVELTYAKSPIRESDEIATAIAAL